MSSEAVAVTGMGAVSALGVTVDESLDALFAGVVQEPGAGQVVNTLDHPPATFAVSARELSQPDPRLTRTSRLGLVAVEQAVRQAWSGAITVPPARIGVCMGTTVGSTFNEEEFYRAFRDAEQPHPTPIRRYLSNDLARVVAHSLGAEGPVVVAANACASSADAIGMGRAWIRADLADVVVAGGADELARFPFLGFASLKNASTARCRPFDRDREGLNLGEGGAAVVLERESAARARGADVLGRIVGYGAAADAYHMTAPHPEGRGLRRAVENALAEAGIAASELAFVNAHGTGTRENDRIEGRLLLEMAGEAVPVFSSKGYTGHTLGAAGALEAVLSIACLNRALVPRSAGFETVDPEIGLVPTTANRRLSGTLALSTSLAFGGTNAALVVSGKGR